MARPTLTPVKPEPESEVLRRRMEDGSLNLRGVVHALHILERDHLDDDAFEAIGVVRILAQVVDREADAMADAEVFLLHKKMVA